MKTLAEFAKNQSWLEKLQLFAQNAISAGISPTETVLVTHRDEDDPRYAIEPLAIINETSKLCKPYNGMTQANLVELPEGMTLGKLSNYTLPDYSIGGTGFDKATNDQIAAVMLQVGTPEQQSQALQYANIGIPGHLQNKAPEDRWMTSRVDHPIKDWVDVFIETERVNKLTYTDDELVIVKRVLDRLQAARPK